MGIVTTTVNKTHKMRAFLAITFFASLALSQKSECSNFLQFSTSRKRRQAVSTTVPITTTAAGISTTTVPPTTTTTEAKPQSTTAAVTTGTTGAVSQPVSTEAQPSGSTVVSGSVEPV